MTSPQVAALDVAPANATRTEDSPHYANDAGNLTAEAQAEPVEAAPNHSSSQHEGLNETLQQRIFPDITENNAVGPNGQNGVEAEQQQGETSIGAGDASIPNMGEDLQNNHLDQPNDQALSQDVLPPDLVANVLAAMRNLPVPQDPYGHGPDPFAMSTDQYEAITAMAMAMVQQPYADLDPEPVEERQVQAYAKLEFTDGAYYMNTYSVDLGRDQVAAKKALRREKALLAAGLSVEANAHIGNPVTSNSAGILVAEDDPDKDERRSKKGRSKKSKKSQSSQSSQKRTRRDSLPYQPGVYPIQSQRAGSDTEAVPVDPASLHPPSNACPLVGIHPANSLCFQAYKNISRRHVKIAFNSEISAFELHVLGRNGCFLAPPGSELELDLKPRGTTHVLSNGSRLQIGEVFLTFLLPANNVTEGPSHGDDGTPGLQDTMYFDEHGRQQFLDAPVFRDARGKEMNTDHSQEIRRDAGDFTDSEDGDSLQGSLNGVNLDEEQGQSVDDEEEDEEGEGEFDEEDEEEGEEEEIQGEMPQQSIEDDESPRSNTKGAKLVALEGRKGPGRPPKNGVMSKRAERELKKQAQEAAVAEKLGTDGSEAPKKGKVGRPRKHPLPDPETLNKPKRKYTKRKPKENQEGNPEGAASGGDGTATTTKIKKEKAIKPPRSPSPVFKEEDLLPEQLIKPAENYVVIIYNAMIASPHKEMGLPQIYNAIKRAYPYFAVKTETKGWESSVRHNLSGNPDVFEKGVKDGKGHMWSLKPGASIDKEKKKKAPPEPQFQGHAQVIQQAPHNMHGHQHPGMGFGYPPYPPPPNGTYPMVQQFMPHPGPPYPHPQQNGFQPPPANWQPGPFVPPYIPAALAPPPPSHSYSSPYAQKAAESDGPPSNNEPHAPPSGQPQPSEQKPAHQPSPPATATLQPHPPHPPQYQNPYPPQTHGPHPQMQYGPTPPPHQYSMPPNPQQTPQHQPPYQPPQSQPPPAQAPSQPASQDSSEIQKASPPQSQIPSPPHPPAIQQASPPQPPQENQAPPPSAPSRNDAEVKEKIDKMFREFKEICALRSIANGQIVDATIERLRKDGDKAVPDPDSPDYKTMKMIIETLRSSLASIEGSGYTAPPPQRSFTPVRTPVTTPLPSPSVNGGSNAAQRPSSTIPRPVLSGTGPARPPMHTVPKRTDSGSPAIPKVSQGIATIPGGGPSTPAAAATPISAQGANVSSPNGASAATSTPVSVPEAIISTQVPAVPTPVERPADVDVTMSIGEKDTGINVNGQQEQNVGRKRSRDEVDGLATEGQENVKRVAI
ncbi:uncharacterized protein LY89DRAFT_688451 [Mollisia scopiformis]|uniref:Uncharacterized protein n=1 Tax=Mollisia scopiformis TaxID=149040 RepID=A0A194WVH7_MOLSC|nr:uncharacterized protein LY89DRAFT_688451 [Mollisia scopiformis]KUJ11970.1 hypothetical protein LY89DRAFT_688451 [Mollisia scopiformis]